MTPMIRSGLTLLTVLALSGCTSAPDSALADATASQVLEVSGPTVDIRFAAPMLRTGESIVVESGDVRMTSTAEGDAHRVRLVAPGRTIRRTVGLLDGKSQLTSSAGTHEGDGGVTSLGPTSVHRYYGCQAGQCGEVVEYDYDLHDPEGDGTAQWRTPDGRSATIDRLRFELEAVDGVEESASVRVTTPEPLALVQATSIR